MPIDTQLKYSSIEDLHLDPKNPRLGRHNTEKKLSQAAILDLMKRQTLEELAVSFLESGFWQQEAVIVVEEEIGKTKCLVVVEGNRRLAALKLLHDAKKGDDVPQKWRDLVSDTDSKRLEELKQIPYIKAESRHDVQGFLGFRHVTGIKEWQPAEKAEYIARLIDKEGMSYQQVMRLIGSKIHRK
jgi:ParB-like chromosome segregation protein Spo0J